MTHLAFFGLGFDFSLLEEMAGSLTFKLLKSNEESFFYRNCVSPSGIELLILLNRETGGS